jgi:hypothetical protein
MFKTLHATAHPPISFRSWMMMFAANADFVGSRRHRRSGLFFNRCLLAHHLSDSMKYPVSSGVVRHVTHAVKCC